MVYYFRQRLALFLIYTRRPSARASKYILCAQTVNSRRGRPTGDQGEIHQTGEGTSSPSGEAGPEGGQSFRPVAVPWGTAGFCGSFRRYIQIKTTIRSIYG